MNSKRNFLIIVGLVCLITPDTFGGNSIQHNNHIEKNNDESKLTLETNLSEDNEGLTRVMCAPTIQNLDSTYLIPQIEIRYKVINNVTPSDARNIANDEIEISFLVNGVILEKIIDFGEVYYDREGLTCFVYSSIAEKSYKVQVIDNDTLSITKTVFFDGEASIQWIKTYQSFWTLAECDGDC